jgi:hypothetical protein
MKPLYTVKRVPSAGARCAHASRFSAVAKGQVTLRAWSAVARGL